MLISNTYNQHFAKLSAEQLAQNATKKVICGMSGGVDSSVSAFILQQQGYQVEGLFMKNWEEDDDTDYCTAAADLADAQAVCDKLGIKLHKINFAAEYWDNVFEHFLSEYKAGRTPNPDILCNKEIKFKDFLARYLPAQPGNIRTVEGGIIGRHDGLMYHTLGQRKGLGIGGVKGASEEAWYVVEKDLVNNELIVAQGHDHSALLSTGLIAQQLHWVDRQPIREPLRCTVKTRYRQTDVPCTIEPIDDESIKVIFDEPQIAVTPGQSAVFYLDEVCFGGGIIEQQLK